MVKPEYYFVLWLLIFLGAGFLMLLLISEIYKIRKTLQKMESEGNLYLSRIADRIRDLYREIKKGMKIK